MSGRHGQPVAARAYGYIGVTAYEAVASGSDRLRTLAGQLNGLAAMPPRITSYGMRNRLAVRLVGLAFAAVLSLLLAARGPQQRASRTRNELKLPV